MHTLARDQEVVSSVLGVSAQSETIPSREHLENKLQEFRSRFKDDIIPKPPHWGGYLLTPTTVEYWQGGAHRLHDRIQYFLRSRILD